MDANQASCEVYVGTVGGTLLLLVVTVSCMQVERGRECHVGQLQVVKFVWPSSRVVTDSPPLASDGITLGPTHCSRLCDSRDLRFCCSFPSQDSV